MRSIEANDREGHLCASCKNSFATCLPTIIDFGDGLGNDNVIKCSEYNGPMKTGYTIGELAPKTFASPKAERPEASGEQDYNDRLDAVRAYVEAQHETMSRDLALSALDLLASHPAPTAEGTTREGEPDHHRIYVASSWKNEEQPGIVKLLRAAGQEVYDFRHPQEGDDGFSWSEIDPDWKNWEPEQYLAALEHPAALRGFGLDWQAMEWADTGVLVLPCGKSAHLEAGYFVGAKKQLYILMLNADTPELMYKMATKVCLSEDEIVKALAHKAPKDESAGEATYAPKE